MIQGVPYMTLCKPGLCANLSKLVGIYKHAGSVWIWEPGSVIRK